MSDTMRLYDFFRSGSAHRLRIALNLKGLTYEQVPVDLRSEQHMTDDFRRIHPQGFVPVLETDGHRYIQSPAIIEWLEECYPEPPLLPASADERARVRALAAVIGCDIHPLNNRRVLEHLRHVLSVPEDRVTQWCRTWIDSGFAALEALLASDAARGRFCFGDTPTMADIYLVPQVESARRFQVDLSRYPTIMAIAAECDTLDAFHRAKPSLQPDAT
jgi:maleylpyruvate isomerase